MTCEERLSHAIHIDKIKIFPNSSAIIEKSKVRHIQETHEDRVELKHVYNPYTLKYETKNIHLAHDFKDSHIRSQANKDQTWYFVLADCRDNTGFFIIVFFTLEIDSINKLYKLSDTPLDLKILYFKIFLKISWVFSLSSSCKLNKILSTTDLFVFIVRIG